MMVRNVTLDIGLVRIFHDFIAYQSISDMVNSSQQGDDGSFWRSSIFCSFHLSYLFTCTQHFFPSCIRISHYEMVGRWLVFWCSIFSKMIFQWTHMWVPYFPNCFCTVGFSEYSACLCRYLRLRRPLVGYQLWLIGIRHIFISINGSQMNSSLIWTVFYIHMVSSAADAPRKWISSKQRNPRITPVLY